MNSTVSLASLLPFGEKTKDGVLLTRTCVLQIPYKESAACALLSLISVCEGEAALSISLTAAGQKEPLYLSHAYSLGGEQTLRVPPRFLPCMTLGIHFTLAEGARVTVRALSLADEPHTPAAPTDVRHNAHLGFWGMAPDNTLPAFRLAADAGFSSCIAVPKETKDGELVCIHDDTVNRTARDASGRKLETPAAVGDMTLAELRALDFGLYYNEVYRGTRIPLLSEFFDLCAARGMRPMFSTHPNLSDAAWQRVRRMLEERGLLAKFHVKSFELAALKSAYRVFGTDIDGYTYDVGEWHEERIDELLACGFDRSACRVGIEIQYKSYIAEVAAAIRAAGFFAAAWNVGRRKFEDYRRLIGYGVSEFTEDYHCSMGLVF